MSSVPARGPGEPVDPHRRRFTRIYIAVATFCLALITAIWVLTSDRISFERSQAMESAAQQNGNLVLAYEEDIERTIRAVDQTMLTIRRAVLHNATKDDVRAILRDAVADSGVYSSIAVVDARGYVTMSTLAHVNTAGTYVGDDEYFKVHVNDGAGLYVASLAKGRHNEGWVQRLSRRISRRDGSFAGVLVAALRPSYLVGFYGATKLGTDGLVTLIGTDGISRARRTGSHWVAGTDMRDSSVFKAVQQEAHGTVISRGRIEGIPRILSYRRLPQYPLIVAVGTSVDGALQRSRQRANAYIIASAAATLVILVCLGFFIAVMVGHRKSLHALVRSEDALAEAQHIARLGSWEVTLQGHGEHVRYHVRWSDAMYSILGLDPDTTKPSRERFLALVHPDDREYVESAFRNAVADLSVYSVEHRMILPNGEERYMVARGKVIPDAGTGLAGRVIGTLRDITEQKDLEHQLLRQANVDALTGLPNRRGFHDRLGHIVSKARRSLTKVCVLFIDLDKFKSVNDSLGHEAGDDLLREMALRFKRCTRGQDLVARLGGDEFAVIVGDLAGNETAAVVASRILEAFTEPLHLGEHELLVTASIGIATYPDDSLDVNALMKNADTAMYEAKESGGNRHAFYSAAMNRRGLERLLIIGRLRRAIENHEFQLVYQPVVNARSGKIASCEALLRWRRDKVEMCSPHEFVPALESSGLVLTAGEWVIRSVCEQLNTWLSSGKAVIPVAVNLSARQFQEQDLVATLSSALAEFQIPVHLFRIEITETTVMARPEENARTLERIADMGIHVAIDDFGTGYSSLSYLKRFHIDSLKIDSSFVRGLPENRDDASICRAVITMAHNLHMTVVAEGVEQEEQLAFLVENECDDIQGFLFSQPLSAEELQVRLATQDASHVVMPGRSHARAALSVVPPAA